MHDLTYHPPPEDILSSTADLILIPVNCIGVMGAGLAKQFAIKHPAGLAYYKRLCADKEIKLGKHGRWWANRDTLTGDIVNKFLFFPTKHHYKDKSDLILIESGLLNLYWTLYRNQIPNTNSVAIPALGCGLGGLKYHHVHASILTILVHALPDIDWHLYTPKSLKDLR